MLGLYDSAIPLRSNANQALGMQLEALVLQKFIGHCDFSRADVSPGALLIRVSDRHAPKEEILCTGKG